MENNPEKVWFELRNIEYYSNELIELEGEVDQLTLVVRRSERVIKIVERYIPPNFHSAFMLTSTNDEPNLVGEAVDLEEGKI
jgi:hypothetical protein